MPTIPGVYIDSIVDLACSEKRGVIHSLTRKARVLGLEDVDYTSLQSALTSAGVPVFGNRLVGVGFEALLLADRAVKMVDGDPGAADVLLYYKHPLDEEGIQSLGKPNSISNSAGTGQGVIWGRMRTTVQQRSVDFYTVPPQDQDPAKRVKIKVFHDFSKGPPETGYDPVVNEQGGTIQVQTPQKVYDFSGWMTTPSPWLVAKQMTAVINSTPFQGDPPFQWMCTEVHYEIMTLFRYKFYFQFTHNPDSWLYRPIWIYQDTGKPHPNPISGQDYFDVHYHNEVDFNNVFIGFFGQWGAPLGS